MSETPSYVSQPQVIDLPKLLADVRAGHIQVPRFQRPFVWEDDRRVELLRSLRAGIPIGSLLVWRTSQTRLRSFDAIAGFSIPPPGQGQTVSYLLDGHQRLTTLFAAFSAPVLSSKLPSKRQDDDVPAPIFFDLEQNDFVVDNPADAWSCISLHLFLDPVALRQHFRAKEREKSVPESEIDRLQEIAEGVLYAMQWCRIPVIPLSTDDVELATRTFHRVNSQGVPMTEFHMIAALTWGDKFDLREIFEKTWNEIELPYGWAPAGEQQTLNVLKGILGMDLSRTTGDLLARRVRDRAELAKSPALLLSRAMKLAAVNLVSTPIAVPYQLQLTMTAIALHEVAPDDVDLEWLRRWWGLTTTWGIFASAASHRVQAALRHLRLGIVGKHEPWPELLFSSLTPPALPNLELRNARAKYFAGGYAVGCGKIDLLHTRGPRAIISLVPGYGTRMGNRFIWESENTALLLVALELGDLEALKGHFVDEGCIDAWQNKDFDEFVNRRESTMNDVDRNWFRGLQPGAFIKP